MLYSIDFSKKKQDDVEDQIDEGYEFELDVDSKRLRKDIQKIIDEAKSGDTIEFGDLQIELDKPLEINTENLTITGLNAKCAKKGKPNELLVVHPSADNFTLSNCEFEGYGDYDDNRKAFVSIYSNNPHVSNIKGFKGSKDCILICAEHKNITAGFVSQIEAMRMGRDTVSLQGCGEDNKFVSGITVDGVKSTESEYKGAVETSDGSSDNTLRNITYYGKNQEGYAVDVQDHGRRGQTNTNITLFNIKAYDAEHCIKSANHDFGHSGLTIKNCLAEDCEMPIALSNTDNIILENFLVLDKEDDDEVRFTFENCRDITVNSCLVNSKAMDQDAQIDADDDDDEKKNNKKGKCKKKDKKNKKRDKKKNKKNKK